MLDLFGHGTVVEHGFGLHRRFDLGQKEVNATQKAIEFVARHLDRFAGFTGHDGRQGLDPGLHQRGKAGNAGLAFDHGCRSPAGLRRARAQNLGGNRAVVVSRQGGNQCAGGGVVNKQLIHGISLA